ncbi:hypothetical protein P5V15_009750 [Pogonomyrmex californicus]
MISDAESEADINSGIQRTLISINDITLKIKKELNMIDVLVKENGLLQTVVGTANETLSKKVHEMGMNVAEIIDEGRRNDRNLALRTWSTINAESYGLFNVQWYECS